MRRPTEQWTRGWFSGGPVAYWCSADGGGGAGGAGAGGGDVGVGVWVSLDRSFIINVMKHSTSWHRKLKLSCMFLPLFFFFFCCLRMGMGRNGMCVGGRMSVSHTLSPLFYGPLQNWSFKPGPQKGQHSHTRCPFRQPIMALLKLDRRPFRLIMLINQNAHNFGLLFIEKWLSFVFVSISINSSRVPTLITSLQTLYST